MADLSPVFEIQQGEEVAPIGVKAENVYINIGTTTPTYITLQDWCDSVIANGVFVQYSNNTPNSDNVKVWFQTPTPSN